MRVESSRTLTCGRVDLGAEAGRLRDDGKTLGRSVETKAAQGMILFTTNDPPY